MIDLLRFRLRFGRQTIPFPDGPARFPARFRGRPVVDVSRCLTPPCPPLHCVEKGELPSFDGGAAPSCFSCADACPTDAILDAGKATMRVDLGRCVFCGDCASACPTGAIRFTSDHRLAARTREALEVSADEPLLAAALDRKMKSLFGRSLKLRQVSAGGCNGCEAELNASGNIQFDLGRFGIQFVASPRHADGIVVTGPIPENMRVALLKTYEAVPAPKLVIAVGACAISGGVFRGSPAAHDGAAPALAGVPVDLFVPGCPPHPVTVLDGLLRLLGRL